METPRRRVFAVRFTVTSGAALAAANTIIGTTSLRTVHGFMPESEAEFARGAGGEPQRMKVADIARELAASWAEQWGVSIDNSARPDLSDRPGMPLSGGGLFV